VLVGAQLAPARLPAPLDSVTVEDVQRVGRDLIERNRMNLAVIGPFDDEDRFRSALG
jgi:predicted Zn-dependent peptidase